MQRKHRSEHERFLNALVACASEGVIRRYHAKMRVGPWCNAKRFNELVKELKLTQHTRDDQWRGQYFKADEIILKLFELRDQLDSEERTRLQRTEDTTPTTTKAW